MIGNKIFSFIITRICSLSSHMRIFDCNDLIVKMLYIHSSYRNENSHAKINIHVQFDKWMSPRSVNFDILTLLPGSFLLNWSIKSTSEISGTISSSWIWSHFLIWTTALSASNLSPYPDTWEPLLHVKTRLSKRYENTEVLFTSHSLKFQFMPFNFKRNWNVFLH